MAKLSNCSHQVFTQSYQKDLPTKSTFFCSSVTCFKKIDLNQYILKYVFHSPHSPVNYRRWVIFLCLGDDDRDWGESFSWGQLKCLILIFWLANPFSTWIWIFFTIMLGYTRSWENLKSCRDESPVGFIQIDDVSFMVILKDCGIKWQCLPFCWSWPGSWKRGDNRINWHWFSNGDLRNK